MMPRRGKTQDHSAGRADGIPLAFHSICQCKVTVSKNCPPISCNVTSCQLHLRHHICHAPNQSADMVLGRVDLPLRGFGQALQIGRHDLVVMKQAYYGTNYTRGKRRCLLSTRDQTRCLSCSQPECRHGAGACGSAPGGPGEAIRAPRRQVPRSRLVCLETSDCCEGRVGR